MLGTEQLRARMTASAACTELLRAISPGFAAFTLPMGPRLVIFSLFFSPPKALFPPLEGARLHGGPGSLLRGRNRLCLGVPALQGRGLQGHQGTSRVLPTPTPNFNYPGSLFGLPSTLLLVLRGENPAGCFFLPCSWQLDGGFDPPKWAGDAIVRFGAGGRARV